MGNAFRLKDNVLHSTIDFIEEQINNNYSGVTVLLSFEDAYDDSNVPPMVVIYLIDNNPVRREIGSTTLDSGLVIQFDIFARHDAERLDLAQFILDTMNKNSWTYYEYTVNESNGTLDKTDSGKKCIVTEIIEDSPVIFVQAEDYRDKYRYTQTFRIQKTS